LHFNKKGRTIRPFLLVPRFIFFADDASGFAINKVGIRRLSP
jgi:hypothetical protein